jgi:hypothetical protein
VCGKDSKIVQVPLPPAVGRAIDRAAGLRDGGPILLNRRGTRMDRHAATRRLRHLAGTAGLRVKVHPHMLRHTSPRCSMLASTCGMSRSPPVTLTRARLCATPTLGNCIRWAKFGRFSGYAGPPDGMGSATRMAFAVCGCCVLIPLYA